ncbi:MAG: hypothetical protein F6J87_22070 [Spirulina sp. SIO3F2]|nr:hypothetical protein [Spirulina sp. SIO3F2]
MKLPWDEREVINPEVAATAEKFILANCYNPKTAGARLRRECNTEFIETVVKELEISVPGNETRTQVRGR